MEGEALAIAEGADAGLAVLADVEARAGAIGVAPARWGAALAQARPLGEMGRTAESRAAAARARASLEAAAAEIDDPALRRSFATSAPTARARALGVTPA